jgi:hypothetical protein
MTATAERSTALTELGRETSKQLSEAEAIELTAQIRVKVQEFLPLIRTAYQRRADLALGYATWESYCDAELSGLRMSVADRPDAVLGLREAGMSQRAIGSALGISPATVNRTLATVSNETVPDRIVGTDKREQPAQRPAAEPKPDLAPTILEALPVAGRDGIDLKGLVSAWADPPAEKDLTRALEKLTKSGEIVVTHWWANKKPRKWASAAVVEDITPDVERVLFDAGPEGRTAWQVAFLIDSAAPPSPRVLEIMHDLIDTGRVLVVGGDADGSLYALTELIDNKTPEPVAAEAATPAAGPGSTSPLVVSGASSPTPETATKTTLRLAPDPDQIRAAEQRDARALLSRGVDLLAPRRWKAEHIQSWIERMGADDEELAELKRRAEAAIAVLHRIIEEAGQ